jgi:hypothetical protein
MEQGSLLFERLNLGVQQGQCNVSAAELISVAKDPFDHNAFLLKYRQLRSNPFGQRLVIDVWERCLDQLREQKAKHQIFEVKFEAASFDVMPKIVGNFAPQLGQTAARNLFNIVEKVGVKVHPAVGIIALAIAAAGGLLWWKKRREAIERNFNIKAVEKMLERLKSESIEFSNSRNVVQTM